MWLLTLAVTISALLWTAKADSCVGRCGSFFDRSKNCQCNSRCKSFGHCCADYDSICNRRTCLDRCGDRLDRSKPCQCDRECTRFKDCCLDYTQLCTTVNSQMTTDTTVTSQMTTDTSVTMHTSRDTTVTSHMTTDTTVTSHMTTDTTVTSHMTTDTSVTIHTSRDTTVTSHMTTDTSVTGGVDFPTHSRVEGVSVADSCAGRCDLGLNSSKNCQCNSHCKRFGDCCSDYDSICNRRTCLDRCGNRLDRSKPCQCNSQCTRFKDCCLDYTQLCTRVTSHTTTDTTVTGGVDFSPHSRVEGVSVADSCAGRCGSGLNSSKNCQCNSHCKRFGDCCSDYDSICNRTSIRLGFTSADLTSIANVIWEKDVNRASPSYIIVNYQGQTSTSSGGEDKASHPFFTYVKEAVLFSRPTYSHFISLLDNYDHSVDTTEHLTEYQRQEVDSFLDAVLATTVMEETEKFLRSRDLVNGNSSAFRTTLHKLWFELYKRTRRGKISSSGFEHVFVGETKRNSVSGFHNWIQFYLEEKQGRLDYKGYVSRSEPDVIASQFSWYQGLLKKKGSFFVGTSPEFDMAIYTICFLTMPNAVCSFRLDGHNVSVQTYDNSNWRGKQIATAYPK